MSPDNNVDTQEMVVAHKVFRRELHLMPDLITGVREGDRERSAVLAEHLTDIIGALHHHHTGEDLLLWPILLERVDLHAELVHRMQRQHEGLAVLIDRIGAQTPKWRAAASTELGAELADTVAQASTALDEHLDDEERDILPIVSKNLTQAEWDALGEYGRRVIPKNAKAMVFIGLILEDATPSERAEFLAQLPAPVRWAWQLFGKGIHERAVERIRGTEPGR